MTQVQSIQAQEIKREIYSYQVKLVQVCKSQLEAKDILERLRLNSFLVYYANKIQELSNQLEK